jgi:predicted HicB family RNase H-like nuclease
VSPQISYRVGESLYANARAKAKAQGRTVSQIARQALEEYISR